MAYVVSTTQTADTNTASFTATLGAMVSGDLMLVYVQNRTGSSSIATATTGWTVYGTQGANGSQRGVFAYKVAASNSETNPVFTGTSDHWAATCLIIRSNGGTLSLDGWQRTDWTGSSQAGNPPTASSNSNTTLLPSVNGDLLIYAWGTGANTVTIRTLTNDCVNLSAVSGNGVTHLVGYRQQDTAATVPSTTIYNAGSTGGNGWVVAIKDTDSTKRSVDVRTGFNELFWYGDMVAPTSPGSAITWHAPSGFASDGTWTGTPGGLAVAAATPTITNTNGFIPASAGTVWGNLTNFNDTTASAAAWVGAYHSFSAVNMSGLIFTIQFIIDSVTARFGSLGFAIAFTSGSNNWTMYQLAQKQGIAASTFYTGQIAVGQGTALASNGSIDWTAVTGICLLTARGAANSQIDISWLNATLLGNTVVTGGGSARPATWAYVHQALATLNYLGESSLQASAQNLVKGNIQIGDGSTRTVWDSSASSLEYPTAYNATYGTFLNQNLWNCPASVATVNLKASSGDTIDLTACLLNATVGQSLTIDAGFSTSSTFSSAGTSLGGLTVTDNKGLNWSGTTFSGCQLASMGAAQLTNCIFTGGTGTALISATTGFSDTGGTYTASSTAVYAIRIAAAGSFTLDNTTFSGSFTKDIDVTATTGTVTITYSNMSAPTYQTAGATVVLSGPIVHQSVALSGMIAQSQVWIYDVTSSTLLANANIGAGTTYTWTDSGAASASRQIHLRVANCQGTTAYTFVDVANIGTCGTTSGTATVTYIVNQSLDTGYNLAAVDGSGVTGVTIDATPEISIDLGSGTDSWQQIYAYSYYFLSTATGIDLDTMFVASSDAVNYLFAHGTKIKNNNMTALTITGGWGRDSTTGLTESLFDTSGTAWFSAANASYLLTTGSGPLTPTQASQLASASNAGNLQFSGSNVNSNISAVNGTTVTGAGTANNPWGP